MNTATAATAVKQDSPSKLGAQDDRDISLQGALYRLENYVTEVEASVGISRSWERAIYYEPVPVAEDPKQMAPADNLLAKMNHLVNRLHNCSYELAAHNQFLRDALQER